MEDGKFDIIQAMKRTLKSHSGAGPRFWDIVECAPEEVMAFFRKFEAMRDGFALSQEAEVLNAVASEEYHACAGARPTVLMKWYEVFRDIFILKTLEPKVRGGNVKKDPNDFTTFARTIEPLAFLPDYWFAAERNVSAPLLRDRAHGLRLAFERFMYERGGGGVWGAMDWEMNRFLQTRIYDSPTANSGDALRRIAALALSARAVAAGELGLYVEERDDVTLPLSGFSNVWNDPNKPNRLLKYYHYDHFTQLSFAREHEIARDPNVPGTHVKFERQWMAMAVLSDVILKESDAHSTHAAATRVMLESVAQCMARIQSKMRGKQSCNDILSAAGNLYDLVSFDPKAFAGMSEKDLLKAIGVHEQVVDSSYYLDKCGFQDVAEFWERVLPVFREFSAVYNDNSNRIVVLYTEAQRKAAYKDKMSTEQFVRNALVKGNVSELPGEVGREGLRDALMSLMLEGSVSLQYATLADALLGRWASHAHRVSYWSEDRRMASDLPDSIPFSAAESEDFGKWVARYLSELSARCAEGQNEAASQAHKQWMADWRRRKGAKVDPHRNRFPFAKSVSYAYDDFASAIESADKLWDFYFTEDAVVRDRWIVSIARVLEIMDDQDVRRKGNAYFNSTYAWSSDRELRSVLRSRLEAEKLRFVKAGHWPKDMDALRASLLKRPSFSIMDGKLRKTRILVMIAVFARLMVHTALALPALWDRRDDLFSLFTHLLVASNHKFKFPFPWHLDIFSDSYLRLGRTHSRQTNEVDDIVSGKFFDESERMVFIIFVAHYLAGHKDAAATIRAISSIPSMKAFFACGNMEVAEQRLEFLKSYFA